MPCPKLLSFLIDNEVDFHLRTHAAAFAARDVAFKAGWPRRMFAKAVIVKLDGKAAMAVLPAHSKVDCSLLGTSAGAATATLASEAEFQALFPDCEPGAIPPLGNLYGLPVYVAGSLIRADTIAFNAGSHTEVVTMPFDDYRRLVAPQISYFAIRELKENKARG